MLLDEEKQQAQIIINDTLSHYLLQENSPEMMTIINNHLFGENLNDISVRTDLDGNREFFVKNTGYSIGETVFNFKNGVGSRFFAKTPNLDQKLKMSRQEYDELTPLEKMNAVLEGRF